MQNQEAILLALMTPKHEIIKNQLYLGNGEAAEQAIEAAAKSATKPAIALIRCTHSVAKGETEAKASGSILHLDVKFGDNKFAAKTEAERDEVMKYLNSACDFIDDALSQNIKVLVHCDGGAHRSPTIVMAYLMKKERIDAATAEARVKRIRACVDADNHREFLKLFQQQLNIPDATIDERASLMRNDRSRNCQCRLV